MTLTLNPALKPIDIDFLTSAAGYEPATDKLVKAFDVARLLGKPLLLTGEPGSGKSLFAKWVAFQLNPDREYLKFVVKSTTEAQDLFYRYDSLARFHDAQTTRLEANRDSVEVVTKSLDYVHYNALGEAILNTHKRSVLEQQGWIDQSGRFSNIGDKPEQSVVLIDEIDKAPRDVPNDLLDEIESMTFDVRELGGKSIRVANQRLRPIVIITSNSERDLPGPFLRRCVYFDVPFPDEYSLRRIVDKRLAEAFDTTPALRDEALEFFQSIRKESVVLSRKPGIAELLDWMSLLAQHADTAGSFNELDELDSDSTQDHMVSALIKNAEDTATVAELWRDFRRKKSGNK